MDETVICTLDEGPAAASTAAFGVWLGECLGARPFVCRAVGADEIMAVAAEHRARVVVKAGGDPDSDREAMELVSRFHGTVVVLPAAALEQWRDPASARRRLGRAIIVGSDGSAVALDAARIAGRVAAGLGGRVVVVHASPRPESGAPGDAPMLEGDLLAGTGRRALIAPALAAAGSHGAAAQAYLASGGVAQSLTDLAAMERAPMIALGTSRASVASVALADSVTAEMLTRGEQPLLIASRASKAGVPARVGPGRAERSRQDDAAR